MQLEALMGRYFRLRQELAVAYQQVPWQSGLIDRIAEELSQAEHALAMAQGIPRSLNLNAPLQQVVAAP